eukprot:Rhum_TRINITY_DN6174_c0_g2::Rhum_TRINITY_DN6174_c0_g2_i1::g.19288::m.19288
MTSQYSTIESWRNDVRVEDRTLKGEGCKIGTLTEEQARAEYKTLRGLASNTRGHSIGNANVPFEERVFIFVYFPPEARTPPCYMFYMKEYTVGKLKDRLLAMVGLDAMNTPEAGARFVRLSTHTPLPQNSELKDISPPLSQHEQLVLTFGTTLPPTFPPPSKQAVEAELAAAALPEVAPVAEEAPAEEAALVEESPGDLLEGSPDVPPDGTWLATMPFKNKKFQPLGDPKAVPGPKRVQLAVFVMTEKGVHRPVYGFYHKEWPVGRCVDSALEHADVSNPNLKVSDPTKKLVMFSLRSLRLLPNSTALEKTGLASGDTVFITFSAGLPRWVAAECTRYTKPTPEFEKEAKRKVRECCIA